MSDCVFLAWRSIMHRHGKYTPAWLEKDYRVYQGIKARWQPDPTGYTEMALVPHIIRTLAARHGMVVKVQHRLYSVAQARQVAWQERNLRVWMATFRWPDWGEMVETLDLPQAIYLQVVPSKHAYYRETPLDLQAGHLMALQATPYWPKEQ